MATHGVLLPLRLETRFIPPGMSADRPEEADPDQPDWLLRLRVIPDRASITTERLKPSHPELVALQALWNTLSKDAAFPDPLPEDAASRLEAVGVLAGWTDAFARLAALAGPARARQLVGAVPAIGSPPHVPEAAADRTWLSPTVRGLPADLDVWVAWRGADPDAPTPQPEVIATLHVLPERLSLDPAPDPDNEDDSPENRWWVSWQAAKDAGLAEEIILPRDPEEIEVLGVSGLGAGDGTTAAALFSAHGLSGDLGVLRPGAATSTVFGSPTVDVVNMDVWSGRTGTGGHAVLDLLAGPDPAIQVPVDELLGIHEDWTQRIVSACYPSLWGYGLQGVLGVLRDPRDPIHRVETAESNLDLWGWATEWLRPEGRFPPIRIGRQVYGVLALAAPSDEVVDGLARAASRATDPVLRTPFAVPLGRIARRWAWAAERGLEDGAPRNALRSSIHGPIPARLRRQRLIPVVTDAIRVQADALDALEREWAERGRVAHTLDQEDLGWRAHGRLYCAFGPSLPLRLPILGPGLDDGREAADPDAVNELLHHASNSVAVIEELGIPGLLRRDLAPESLLLTLYHRSVAVSSQLLWNADPNGAVDDGDPLRRLGLLEPLGAPFSDTRAAHQAEHLALPGEAADVRVPPFLPRAIDPGGVLELLEMCGYEPSLRPIANRAVRALADAAAGRWDVWLAGLGAAHASEAAAEGSEPVLGAYGWVDTPYPDAAWRGKPGPGPGGFRIAPSEAIAGTLAVLRDRAVVDPERWGMLHDSQVVGEARRWLANLALGWHPAELLGRDIERRVAASETLSAAQSRQVIADLRKQYPLREGQGGFGCTHGLDAVNGAVAPEVTGAVDAVRRMLDAAADLALGEGIHGILTDQPARAAAAMRGLGGTERLPIPGWIDPVQPTRPVETVVLFAAPAAAPPATAGPAAMATPGLEALLQSAVTAEPSWVVEVGGTRRRLAPEDLGCGLLDLATLSPGAVLSMAEFAAAAGEGTPTGDELTDHDDLLADVRTWVAALRGRAAAAVDVARDPPAEAREAQDAEAASSLRVRLESAIAAAELLLLDIVAATDDLAEAEAARIAGELDAAAKLDGDAPPVSRLSTAPLEATDLATMAQLALAAARWAFLPPDCGAALASADPATARGAAADLAGFLLPTAERLAARVDAAKAAIPSPLAPDQPVPALTTRPGAAALAAALAELVGRPGLPVGARLTASLDLSAGGAELLEWASMITAVRAGLAAPLSVDGAGRPAGLDVFATEPDDPWRTAAVAELDRRTAAGEEVRTPAAPRLTVALAAAQPVAGDELEWIVLDAFSESVPTSRPVAGASFDVATPSARPPQAILVVPPSDLHAGDPTAEEIRAAVLYARMLAHGRVAVAADLEAAGVGALAAWAVLPQDTRTGAPLSSSPLFAPQPDQPEVLLPDPDDADDIAAAVTADALWMLGQQWRLGEHAGADAATPLRLDLTLSETAIAGTAVNPALSARTTPIEAGVESEPEGAPSAWVSEALHYATELSAGDATLDITEHDAGSAGWWELASREPLADEPDPTPRRSRPSRLMWPGAPTGRYWQIEDRKTDVAGTGPDRTQPATLHLIDVIARAGDDLFVAPLAATPGTIARPGHVTMTDAAGGTWPLRSARDWNLIGITGLDLDPPPPSSDDAEWHRATALLIGAGAPLEGPLLDDVAFALDEDDNLVWAADRRAPVTPSAPPDDGALSDTTAITWRWTLRRSIPAGRYPFLHGFALTPPTEGAGDDAFLRAHLVTADGGIADGPTSPLLVDTPRLAPLAVPASGVRIVRRFALARDVEGRPVLWSRRLKRPLDVPVDVDLRWDALNAEAD